MTMYCTSPASEADTKRLLLISPDIASNGFGGLIATVIREASAEHDSMRDKVATGWRNCAWSSPKPSALYVCDLKITCQLDLDDETQRTYGNQVSWDARGKIQLKESILIAKTLRVIDEKMDKIGQDEGYIYDNDFGGWVARVGAILGIDRFVIQNDPKRGSAWLDQVNAYTVVKKTQLPHQCKYLLTKFYGKEEY